MNSTLVSPILPLCSALTDVWWEQFRYGSSPNCFAIKAKIYTKSCKVVYENELIVVLPRCTFWQHSSWSNHETHHSSCLPVGNGCIILQPSFSNSLRSRTQYKDKFPSAVSFDPRGWDWTWNFRLRKEVPYAWPVHAQCTNSNHNVWVDTEQCYPFSSSIGWLVRST